MRGARFYSWSEEEGKGRGAFYETVKTFEDKKELRRRSSVRADSNALDSDMLIDGDRTQTFK